MFVFVISRIGHNIEINGVGKYDLSKDYQTGLCTHLIFAFGGLYADYRGAHLKTIWNYETLYKQVFCFENLIRNIGKN